MAGARREDQRVVADLTPIENEAPPGEIQSLDLGEEHRDVPGVSQDGPEWRRDVGRVERRGRDLIEQGLKQVVVAPVEQGDPHRPAREGPRGVEPAEATAHHDHAWLVDHLTNRERRAARAPRLGLPFGAPLPLGVLPDECLDASPGIGRGLRELGLLSIEEAVRRARVDRRIVLDAGLAARGVELVDGGLGNSLIGAAEEREYAALVARDGIDRLGSVGPAAEAERPAVEADHAGVAEPARGLKVREGTAEAEAHREDRASFAAVLAP